MDSNHRPTDFKSVAGPRATPHPTTGAPRHRPDLTDSFIQTWLVDHANSHPGIDRAWDNRHQNPAQWADTFKRAVNRLGDSLPQLYVDDRADRESAAHMARAYVGKSVPKAEVTNEQLAAMDDIEFNAYQKSLGVN